MTVLLLNASFEPLRIITLRRALGLVLAGKADLIEAGAGNVRAATETFPVPVVVRLRTMVTLPFTTRVPLNRRTLNVRDHGICQLVGCDARGTTIDHVVPRSKGGEHTWTNTVLMCPAHNGEKGDRLLDELGWELKAPPRAPRGALVVIAASGVQPDAVWEPYLALG